MNHSEFAYYLALQYAPSVGPIGFHKIVKKFASLADFFKLSTSDLIAAGFKEPLITYLHAPAWHAVERDIKWSEQAEQEIITWFHPAYPDLLRQIHTAPPVLYVKGSTTVLAKPQLAMVGTRNPTTAAQGSAFQFAEYLSQRGLIITSGLALGIDGASHQGALAANGATIAVLGNGLEKIYPTRHLKLAEKIIAQGGCIVSEFPLDTAARPENFPRRNRIISGLSLGVLIIEAALQSGSLITAKYALEQGREIFAMPGSIHNPLVKGCHALIKQGAKLVETAADILEELGCSYPYLLQAESSVQRTPVDLAKLDAANKKLLDCIEFVTTPMDSIIQRSGLSAEVVSSKLLLLELQGYLQAVNGGYIRL